jgi:hypothetical protein
MQIGMETTDWNPKETVRFTRASVRVLLPDYSTGALSAHLRTRDTLAKRRIALRELKKARLRMRMLRRCELLTADHGSRYRGKR